MPLELERIGRGSAPDDETGDTAYVVAGKLNSNADDIEAIVDDLETAIAGKAASSHSHAISDVTGLQSALDGKATSTQGTAADAAKAKTDYLTVTQPVDLDTIESRVNELDAAVVLKGAWDASAGTFPGSGAAQAGWSYIVSVGGTVDSQVFTANDRIVAITDNASTSTYAANWLKLDYTDAVLSVAGQTGAISAGDLRTAINVEDGADATDATNVEAAGALMDSEVTNLADVKAFDPTDYATATQGATADAAIPETLIDAAGDLIVGTADNTAGRLAMGTSLQQIRVNSGGTALEYFTPSGGSVDWTTTQTSAGNVTFKLGDNAGTNKFSLLDSGDAEVAKIDSNGKGYFGVGSGRGAIEIGNDGTDARIKKNESSTGWLVFDSNNAALAFSSGTNTTGSHFGASAGSQEYIRIIPAQNKITLRHYTSDFTIDAEHRSGDEAVYDLIINAQEAFASAATHIVGGDLNLNGGAGASSSAGNAHGGNVTISGGAGYGTGHKGYVVIDLSSLPTSDPSVNGALWLDSGVLSVSGA